MPRETGGRSVPGSALRRGLFLLAVALATCPKLCAQVDLTGPWSGTWVSISGDRGSLDATLTQSGSTVTGSLTIGNSALFTTATLSGSVSGSTLTLGLTAAQGVTGTTRGTIAGSTNISGTYSLSQGGFVVDTGTFNLDRVGGAPPSQVSLTGSWSGNFRSSDGQAGTLSATLTQSGSDLTGSLTLTNSLLFSSASVRGTLAGSSVTLTLSATGGYAGEIRGTLSGSDSVAGTYTITQGGSTADTGTFTLARVVPVLSSLTPATIRAGGAGFTLDVRGANFNSGLVVRWNGSDRPTSYVSVAQLQGYIPASDIAASGTARITVFSPAAGTAYSSSLSLSISGTGNPSPRLTSLTPASAAAGSGALTLTVAGSNFISGSVVRWNGSSRVTTFVSATQLRAAISSTDLATAGTAQVTVLNASPGGGTSNAEPFDITVGRCDSVPEPTLRINLPTGFHIVEARNRAETRGGYWGMEVLVSRGILAGGFNLGGGAQENGGTPAFGAFSLPNNQTVNVRVDSQVIPGGNASQYSMSVRLLDSNRQQIGTEQLGTSVVQFQRSLGEGFYIIEVRTGGTAPRATFQLGLGADAFSGGVVVGGFVAPGLVGFGAFYVPETQEVNIRLLGPSYGAGGATCMRLTLLDANRNLIRRVP